MANKTQGIFLEVVRKSEKPLLFGEIAQRTGLHPTTVSRIAYLFASQGLVRIETIGMARRVTLNG